MNYGAIFIPVQFLPLAAAFQFAVFARVCPACGCLRVLARGRAVKKSKSFDVPNRAPNHFFAHHN